VIRCGAVCIIYGMIQPPDHFESISAFKAADVLQCVALCCSVLVCVALCFVEVQRGAACCSVVQYVSYTACSSHQMILHPSLPLMLQVCCGVWQWVVVCCSVLQCVAVCFCMVQRVTVFRSMFLVCAFNIAMLRPRRRVTDK